jgi:hypothetical protein
LRRGILRMGWMQIESKVITKYLNIQILSVKIFFTITVKQSLLFLNLYFKNLSLKTHFLNQKIKNRAPAIRYRGTLLIISCKLFKIIV